MHDCFDADGSPRAFTARGALLMGCAWGVIILITVVPRLVLRPEPRPSPPPPEPIGACCREGPDGAQHCFTVTKEKCLVSGGEFAGYVPCSPLPCE